MTNMFDMQGLSVPQNIINLYFMGLMITNHTLTHPVVQDFLKSKQKFDVVILENFVNEAILGFGAHFKAPIIELSTFGPNTWINEAVGIPSPLSYVPHPFLSYTDTMTFFERFWNLIINVLDYTVYKFYFLNKHVTERHGFIPGTLTNYIVLFFRVKYIQPLFPILNRNWIIC